jgi:hypothetical protein
MCGQCDLVGLYADGIFLQAVKKHFVICLNVLMGESFD